jgi:alkanesulfonate monooxygenase SsuD/methylene tetrahydromethanopterin reductase-like flavin-dependent oxidoreductase (luciferase family)
LLHGISFLPDCTPESKSAAQYFADAFRLAVMADQGGMTSVKMTEHYLHAYGGYCPSPLSFLSNVAARTTRIRLITGCLLPAFHHPVQIAAETAMLDVMSGGRLDVGVARAWLPYEFEVFGVELDDSRELFNETVAAVIRLWTEDSVTVKTKFFELREVSSTPKPLQQPHPPVWGAAVLSPESFVNLGTAGHNLLLPSSINGPAAGQQLVSIYRDAFAAARPAAPAGKVAVSMPLVIGESMQEAVALADRHLAHYLGVWASAGDAWNTTTSSNYRGYTGMSYALRASTPQRLRSLGAVVVGDVPAVIEQIGQLQQLLDVDEILWQVDFGAMPGELAERTLRRLIDEVMPALAIT